MDNKKLNEIEINYLKKIFKLASITKYSMIFVWVSFIPTVVLIITDFITAQYNASRDNTLPFLIANIVVIGIFLLIWCISFIKLKRNILKNDTWKSIIEKTSKNTKIDNNLQQTEIGIDIAVPTYLLGNLIEKSEKLNELGNEIKIVSGMSLVFLVIHYSNLVVDFGKNLFKVYNISYKPLDKIYITLFSIPTYLMIIIIIVFTTININESKKNLGTIINSLNNNCDTSNYCDHIELDYNEVINIYQRNNNSTYSNIKLRLNEQQEIEEYSASFNFDKDLSKDKIIEYVNLSLKESDKLISDSSIECKNTYLCQNHQLINEFVDEFMLSDTYELNKEYELYDNYIMNITTGYMNDGFDDVIYISLNIQERILK